MSYRQKYFTAQSWGFWLLFLMPCALLVGVTWYGSQLGWSATAHRLVLLVGVLAILGAVVYVVLRTTKAQWPYLPLHRRLREFFRYNE